MLKHTGRVKSSRRKVFVAFRTLPGESDSALVIYYDQLSDSQFSFIMNLLESAAGQNSYEFGEVLGKATFEDGSNMLNSLHTNRRLIKLSTSDIEMTPDHQTSVLLAEVNQQIAVQRNVSVNDLALGNDKSVDGITKLVQTEPEYEPEVELTDIPALSDKDIAAKYRADAQMLLHEVANLHSLANSLDPIVEPTLTSVTDATAVFEQAVSAVATKRPSRKPK